MLDFIMGWVLGRNIHRDLSPIEDTTVAKAIEIEPLEEVPNVTRYVHIPEISGFNATLEGCYNDYEKTNLVNPSVIVDTNHNNSGKKYLEQIRIAKDVVHSRNQNNSKGYHRYFLFF